MTRFFQQHIAISGGDGSPGEESFAHQPDKSVAAAIPGFAIAAFAGHDHNAHIVTALRVVAHHQFHKLADPEIVRSR